MSTHANTNTPERETIEDTEASIEVSVPTSVSHTVTNTTLVTEADDMNANASPLHFHITTIEGAKLQGRAQSQSQSQHSYPRSRSRSTSRTRSRSNSRGGSGREELPSSSYPSALSADGDSGSLSSHSRRNSGTSSILTLDDIDPDILTDKMGHEELVPRPPEAVHGAHNTHNPRGGLNTVNERMSEETLDDCHAFTDLKNVIRQIHRDRDESGNVLSGGAGSGLADRSMSSIASDGTATATSSGRNSVSGGSIMEDPGHLLETLEEFEEDDDDDEDNEDDEKEEEQRGRNLEDIDEHVDPEEDVTDSATGKPPTVAISKKKMLFMKKKEKDTSTSTNTSTVEKSSSSS